MSSIILYTVVLSQGLSVEPGDCQFSYCDWLVIPRDTTVLRLQVYQERFYVGTGVQLRYSCLSSKHFYLQSCPLNFPPFALQCSHEVNEELVGSVGDLRTGPKLYLSLDPRCCCCGPMDHASPYQILTSGGFLFLTNLCNEAKRQTSILTQDPKKASKRECRAGKAAPRDKALAVQA